MYKKYMIPEQSLPLNYAIRNGVKYGTIAGLIATWSISTAIAASELELGMPMGTFYSIIGISLGTDNFGAAGYVGFGLHLLTGALLGAVIGYAMSRLAIMKFLNPYRAVLIGMGAGIAVWLMLFLPVTVLLVQPSMDKINLFLSESSASLHRVFLGNANQFIWSIAISAIAFHLVWGAVFGYTASAFLRIKAFRLAHPKGGVM
jgi:hypothetical protein